MKVSVIIPTYNRYKYLLNAIESVTSQTHKDLELIVINDGSTDSEYRENKLIMPPNSILVHMSSNSSSVVGESGRAAYTRNIGMKIATGDYIAFLDDDDYWLPDKIETQLLEMKNSNCEMSCSEAYIGQGPYVREKKYETYLQEYHSEFFRSIKIFEFPLVWSRNFLTQHNSCIASSVIISKHVIDKIGYMPYKRVGEDYAYWLKALEHTNCVFVYRPLLYYDNKHGDGSLY